LADQNFSQTAQEAGNRCREFLYQRLSTIRLTQKIDSTCVTGNRYHHLLHTCTPATAIIIVQLAKTVSSIVINRKGLFQAFNNYIHRRNKTFHAALVWIRIDERLLCELSSAHKDAEIVALIIYGLKTKCSLSLTGSRGSQVISIMQPLYFSVVHSQYLPAQLVLEVRWQSVCSWHKVNTSTISHLSLLGCIYKYSTGRTWTRRLHRLEKAYDLSGSIEQRKESVNSKKNDKIYEKGIWKKEPCLHGGRRSIEHDHGGVLVKRKNQNMTVDISTLTEILQRIKFIHAVGCPATNKQL
jgi:hypothetical protein